ncbi:hypothetical protein LCGC14_1956280 [marine sediment metagenome]|uniref:Uncharacterized protein n=1 Tax=marine sediment metagenome TaxID=412755 RepID=A0A0F9FFZ7_9ZZZZ
MPSHTKAEQKKNKQKKSGAGDSSLSAVGGLLKKLLPGGFSKALLGDVNKKIKKATKK